MRAKIISIVAAFILLIGINPDSSGASPQPLWVFPVGATIQSSPAIGNDGTIYFGADNGIFYALTPEGKKKWEFVTSGAIVSTPAISAEGTIYVASIDRIIYALNPDGTEKWRLMPGSGLVSSPAIAPDGTIYIGSVFNKFFAISPDGFRKWDFPATGNIVSSPAVDEKGNVYFGCMDTNFYAVNTNGAAIWVFKTADKINSSPAFDSEGNIYFGGFDRSIYALDRNGKLLWEFKTEGAVRSSPIIDADGTIYIGSDDGKIYAIDKNGKKKWDFPTKDWVRSTPVISSAGTIYFGSYDGAFYAIGTNGNLIWSYQTDGHISSSPIIGQNNVVYFGSWDKNFYAFKSDAPIAETPWPAFRKNLRRTGCVVPDVAQKPASTVGVKPQLPELKIKPKQPEPLIPEIREPVPTAKPTIEQKQIEVVQQKQPSKEQAVIKKESSAIEKPTIKITSPKNGARVNEEKIIVQGIARHPLGLKAVEFRLNSGTVYQARGLGEWSANVTLIEGDNIFEARSISATGAESEWSRIIIKYIPTYQIRILVNGNGRVSPSVAGKKYESGEKIILKAEPVRGFTFAGWEGSISEKSPLLKITILSNLFLQANFVPEEKFVSEQKNKKESETKKESVKKEPEKAPPSEARLNIVINGKGTVSPYSGEKTLKIGRVYKLIARAETGFIFAGWSGDIESKENEISLNLQTNTTIVANFIPTRSFKNTGDYYGLIREKDSLEPDTTGLIQIDLGADGNWKAKLTFAKEKFACDGKFDDKGSSYVSIKRGSKPPLALVLKLIDEQSNSPVIYGWLTGLEKEAVFSAKQAIIDKLNIPNKSDLYTIVFVAPTNAQNIIGDGFAGLQIDRSGNLQINGKLGDGTQISTTTKIIADHSAPLFVPARNGFLAGALLFTNAQSADILGELYLFKSSKDSSTSDEAFKKYPLRPIGSVYSKPEKGTKTLNATNLVVALSGGGLGSTIGSIVRLEQDNKIAVEFSDIDLTLSIDSESGLFKGSFFHPDYKKTIKYEGAILQKAGWGSGYFNYDGKSGLVFIAPDNPANIKSINEK